MLCPLALWVIKVIIIVINISAVLIVLTAMTVIIWSINHMHCYNDKCSRNSAPHLGCKIWGYINHCTQSIGIELRREFGI